MSDRRAASTDAAILDLVRRRAETTRVEIARELGVTPATVTYAVKRLLGAGLLVESGHARSTGGKRASLLRVNDQARHAIGGVLEGDRLSVVAVDMRGVLRSRVVLPAPPTDEPGALGATLARALEMMKPEHGATTTGIGLTTTQGSVPIAETAVDAIARALDIPAVSSTSAHCAALGSLWSGEQPERGLAITVHQDDSLGIAMLQEGLRIGDAAAAALDHVTVDPSGPACDCGARGCLRAYASPAAVAEAARREDGLATDLGLGMTTQSRPGDMVLVFQAASRGEERAARIASQAAEALATVIRTVTSALGARSVTLTGAGLQAAPQLVGSSVDAHLRSHGQAGPVPQVRISQVRPHPATIGAAVLALQTFLEPRRT